jgi:type IV pilus biogenesis protein CpaD/CtpE
LIMGADVLLSKLDGVKRTGPGRWLAKCPAHEDRRASLAIRESDDGRTLAHCFAGCSIHEVVAAAGLEISDLFPPRSADPAHAGKMERRPFPAADILRAVAFEALVVGCAASTLGAGGVLTDADRTRLLLAAQRIQAALDAGGLNRA